MVKIETLAWSDAEFRIISAKAVAGMLSEAMFNEGNKGGEEVAYSIVLLLEDALASIESGKILEA